MKLILRLYIIVIISFPSARNAMAEDAVEESIRNHRMGTLIINTTPGAKVTVKQLSHEFWFGTAISQNVMCGNIYPRDRENYLQVLKDNFNAAVHENALKWYGAERRQGQITYQNAEAMLKWCEDNGIAMRGHCVFWCVNRYVQPWIKQLDDKALRDKLRQRATGLLSHFKGRISEYDVNNEMLHANYYAKRIGEGIRHDMFRWCREADPDAVLFVNDHNILTGGYLEKYEQQITSLLQAGVPVGGIGLQGHFGSRMDVEKVKRVLDRLARFNLPIKITEFDINTKNEKAKAKWLVDFYTVAFAQPAVNGILMWGFWEGAHWRPKAALWKKNWAPTQAATAYRDLVYRKWWTDFEGTADERGLCEVMVFYGHHKVTVPGSELTVELSKEEGSKSIKLPAQPIAGGDRVTRSR